MLLYLASTENKLHAEIVVSHWTESALTTYYSLKDKPDHIREYAQKYWFKNYFLDSGAYGAWTRNQSLDVVKYGKFLLENKKYITLYANLDDKNNQVNTEKNLKYLESIWLSPLPVWWMDTWDWWKFEELLSKYDYVAVGGIAWVGWSMQALENNLRKVFRIAFSFWKNPDGSMKKKLHWFWTTMVGLMIKYPWYSVDSTTRVWWARFGIIHIFNWKNIVLCQAKDHKKILANWRFIPKDLRDMNVIMDKPWVRNYLNRQKISADCFKQIETYCTKLWRSRGIYY